MHQNIFSIENQHIVITGGTSGIGQAFVEYADQSKAKLTIIGRNKEKLMTLENSLKGKHGYVSLDVQCYSEIENVIKEAVAKRGKINGFVHSAGTEMTLPLKMLKAEHYEKVFAINTISGYEFSKNISKKKYVHESGASFVFIGSVMSVLGEAGKIAYASSKGALISGVKSMALELAKKNIRVNCILPAMVTTEMSRKLLESLPELARDDIVNMHPLGLGTPEDVAYAISYFLSPASKWITGTSFLVDGGYSSK